MTIIEPFNETIVDAALRSAKGNLARVAERLGVGRGELADCVYHRAKLLAIVDDAREAIVDEAESALREAVAEGKSWAIRFSLTMFGARRGYDRELRHAAPRIDADLSRLSDDEWAEIEKFMPCANEPPPPKTPPASHVPNEEKNEVREVEPNQCPEPSARASSLPTGSPNPIPHFPNGHAIPSIRVPHASPPRPAYSGGGQSPDDCKTSLAGKATAQSLLVALPLNSKGFEPDLTHNVRRIALE